MREKLYEILRNLNEDLTESEFKILLFKYTSCDDKIRSIYEVAENFNITPSRVLQHEERIAKKLKVVQNSY